MLEFLKRMWEEPEAVAGGDPIDEGSTCALTEAAPEELAEMAAHLRRSDPNVDDPQHLKTSLCKLGSELVASIDDELATSRFELPRLPATAVSILQMASDPTVDIDELIRKIATDPALTTEILRAANSVGFGGQIEIDSIQTAVVRVGLNSIRNLVFSLSLRSALFDGPILKPVARSIWHQAYSCANLAGALGRDVGVMPETAFLFGLLHDLGKVPLVAMLRGDPERARIATDRVLHEVFRVHHEAAGELMAAEWRLPTELRGVIGQHHNLEAAEEPKTLAALVSLVHRMDLHLSTGDLAGFLVLRHTAPEWTLLETAEGEREALMDAALAAFAAARREDFGV